MRCSVIAIVAVTALTGCATVFSKPYQDIEIVTPGVQQADCTLQTPNNQYRAITPQNIKIERSPDTLVVTCERALYHTATMNVVPELKVEHTAWNVFNGIIPGLATDIATESIYEYPHRILVPMELDPQAVADSRIEEREVLPLQRKTADMPFIYKADPDPVPAGASFSESLGK